MRIPATIAVIENHLDYRICLTQVLEATGYFKVVIDAGSSKDFFDRLSTHASPEIILLDTSIIELDGSLVLSKIQRLVKDAKVIIHYEKDDIAAESWMQTIGAKACLPKATSLLNMVHTLHAIADGRSMPMRSEGLVVAKSDTPSEGLTLNNRELEFLKYACTDLSYIEVAQKMNVSRFTIDNYSKSLFRKFRVESRIGLVLAAIKHKMIDIK